MFSMQSVSFIPLIATFQMSSAASFNLGRFHNGVLGKGLTTARRQISDSLKYKEVVDYNISRG